MADNPISPDDLQTLIQETAALGWDNPEQLEIMEEAPPHQEAFAILGRLLTLKPVNSQLVQSTLALAWSFAAPLTVEIMAPNLFLFAVPQKCHMERILQQGPWNIRGSLLLLHPWSLVLAINEVVLNFCPFWVQIHGLPMQNMTTRNAIMIGKALGSLLEVKNCSTVGLICRQHLRIKVDLNTSNPLVPGFHIPRSGKDPLWVNFKYERLADYCTLCGLIGHKKLFCLTPPSSHPHTRYGISLKATSFSSPRVVSATSGSTSGSGLSSEGQGIHSEASGTASHGGESTRLQIIPRNTMSQLAVQDSNFSQDSVPLSTKAVGKQHVGQFQNSTRCCGSPSSTSSEASFSPSSNATRAPIIDKGKALLITAQPLFSNLQSPIINAADFPLQYYYRYSSPYLMDSTITNIQEISEPMCIPLQHYTTIGPPDFHFSNMPGPAFNQISISPLGPPVIQSPNLSRPVSSKTNFSPVGLPKYYPSNIARPVLNISPISTVGPPEPHSPKAKKPISTKPQNPSVGPTRFPQPFNFSPNQNLNRKSTSQSTHFTRFHPYPPKTPPPTTCPFRPSVPPPQQSPSYLPDTPVPPLAPILNLLAKNKKKRVALGDTGEASAGSLKKSKQIPVPQYDSFTSMEMAALSLASLKSSAATMGPFTAFLHSPLSSTLSDHFPNQGMQISISESSFPLNEQGGPLAQSRLSRTASLTPSQAAGNISSFGTSSTMSFGARTVTASTAINPDISRRYYRALRGNRRSGKASQADGDFVRDDVEVHSSDVVTSKGAGLPRPPPKI